MAKQPVNISLFLVEFSLFRQGYCSVSVGYLSTAGISVTIQKLDLIWVGSSTMEPPTWRCFCIR